MKDLSKFSKKKRPDIRKLFPLLAFGYFSIVLSPFIFANEVEIGMVINQERRIRGTVVDSDGEPIIGANVVIKNTNTGVITNLDGEFELQVPASGSTLVISYIGYTKQEISINNQTTFHIIMESDTETLDEVVVTALGIKREKKALGYAMQEIKADDLAETRSPSLANMLQGKVAGVQIAQSATGIGGSTRVVLRGLNSLSGNNSPLWVIDGIPIDDSDAIDSGLWGGGDRGGSASDINPDDIESISVLKGPNAAALYGSRASNGVILITTKKAEQGQPISVNYNGNFSWSKVYDGYNLQDTYGQGNNGEFSITSLDSWGPVMQGQLIPSWKNQYYSRYGYNEPDYPMVAQKNRIKDFFDAGFNTTNNVAIQGGGQHLAARFSFTDSRNNGIVPNNTMVRDYFDLNVNFQYERLTVNVKGTYTKQETNQRVGQGVYGLMHMFNTMPGNIRLSDLRDWEAIDGIQMNWTGPSAYYYNPYALTSDKKESVDARDRLTGIATLNFKFTDYLGITIKLGRDYILNHSKSYGLKSPEGNNTTLWLGEYRIDEGNYDAMLNFNKYFGDFSVTANVGAAMRKWERYDFNGNSGPLELEGLYTLANGSKVEAGVSSSEKEVHSVLGNVQLGYKNWLYLDITARNDWSSTLNPNNWSYFYPSFSLSGVISDMIQLPEYVSFLKVRGSWAQVGNDTDPYQLYDVVWLNKINGETTFAELPGTRPFYDLKPEKTKSWEVGLDARFLNNRLGIDFTYYNSKTTNQILSLGTSPTTGYTAKKINAGLIQSKGVELMINTTPVRTRDVQWDLNLNWGTNTTECIELDELVKRHIIDGLPSGSMVNVVVDEGSKYGDIIGKGYERDENGNIYIDDNGLPVITEDKITLGNMLPDWTGSIFNMVRYKDFYFQMLIDVRKGGDLVSLTDAAATHVGTSERTLAGRDGMVVPGIVRSTGEVNTKQVTAQQYWNSVGGYTNGVAEEYMYDGSFVMLRELSLGYHIPRTYLNKTKFIKAAKISLVGRDLGYLFKNTPGTSPEGAPGRRDWMQAIDLNSLPPARNFGFNVNLTF